MTVTKLTLEEKQTRLEKIASYSLEVLRTATMAELKELAKGFIKGYSKLNRDQLLGELIRASEDVRIAQELALEAKRVQDQAAAEEALLRAREGALKLEAAMLQDPTTEQLGQVFRLSEDSDKSDLQQYGSYIYDRIKDIANESLRQVSNRMEAALKLNKGISFLATQVISDELRKYPKITTRKSRRTDYLNALAAAYRVDSDKDNKLFPKELVLSGIESFRELLYAAWREETVGWVRDYKQKVKASNEERIELDPTALIQETIDVLSNPTRYRWVDLAKGLAIATGRRPSEILVTAKFVKLGEYEVSFSGCLKGRRDQKTGASSEKLDETLVIPTLVKADLVMAGMAALEATGKRLPPGDDPVETCEKAHSKYQSSLNKLMSGSGYVFKDLRKIYIVVARTLFKSEAMDTGRFYQNLLGHGDGETSQSYNKYYLAQQQTETIKALVGI